MGSRVIQEELLNKLAEAIRIAEGSKSSIKLKEMPEHIVNLRKTILNNQPKAKVKGNFIQLNDISEIPQYITINVSNSANKNVIISNANLLDLNFEPQTKNHLICEKSANGRIKLSGHTSEDILFELGPHFLLKPETYTFGFNNPNYIFIFEMYNDKYEKISEHEVSQEMTFTITENTYCKCYLKVFQSSNIILTYLSPMLNLGTTLLPFEPLNRQKYNVNFSDKILIEAFPYLNVFAESDAATINFEYYQSAGIVFMKKKEKEEDINNG